MLVHCEKCDHEWEVHLPLPLSIKKAVKKMRGAVMLGCPECGADDDAIICGPAKKERP